MKETHPIQLRARAQGALLILVLLMGVLVIAFFRAQVVRGTTWTLQSDSNRLRVLPAPAPRGTIFDRYGRIVADNVPSYSISLFPAPSDSIRATLDRLAPLLDLSGERIEELVQRAAQNRRQPLLVIGNADYEAVAAVEELRADFPGVFLEMRPRRRYLGGPAVGHALGYVGEVSAQELESPRFEGYEQGMIVGKEGLERQYEHLLQGTQGVRYLEVDAVGRVVGSFEGHAAAPAIPGDEVFLNLDLELLEYIHEIFPDTTLGAVVALNVSDGGVLALYSSPAFDPNDFVGGISRARWEALNQDPRRPLFNRSTMGRYPPASTFKLATAAVGLELGVVNPEEYLPQACYGSYTFQGVTRRCWRPEGHGHLNLAGAIAHSCNVYFYQLGLRIGLERFVQEGNRLGFGELCGIDLPRESAGEFPDGLDYWQRRWGYRPFENEVLGLSIGGGPNDQTPLKMAQFYMALAGDGSAPAPRLIRDEAPPMEEAWTMDLSPANLESLREGLRQVSRPGGTAYRSSLELWDLIGKTGTAQAVGGRERPHSWFAGMVGPRGGDPEIVIVVLLEESEGGAAPIAAKAADFHLRRKHGIPVDSIQTLGEHIEAGRPAPWAW
jgi:penicillin-binding protein 2